MARRVNDAPLLIHQDQVGVPAHHFQDQQPLHMVAQLVDGVHGKVQHAVAAKLLQGCLLYTSRCV